MKGEAAVLFAGFSAAASAFAPSPDTLAFIVSCGAGTYAAFAFSSERIEPRSRLYNVFLGSFIMGLAVTTLSNALIAHFTGMVFANGTKCALGAFVSCITRYWLPSLIDNIKSGNWINWIPFLNRNKKEG